MLPLRRHGVAAPRRRKNRLVIRLRPAGREDKRKLRRIRDLRNQIRTRFRQKPARFRSAPIERRRIIIAFLQKMFCMRKRPVEGARRRSIVKIDHCLSNLFRPAAKTRYSSNSFLHSSTYTLFSIDEE